MISHKVMRYLVPFFLLAALVSNYALVDLTLFPQFLKGDPSGFMTSSFMDKLFTLFLAGQGLFYLSAVVGYLLNKLHLKRLGPLALPVYFVLVNLAVLIAMLKSMSGERYVVWEPIRETGKAEMDPLRHMARG